MNLVTLWSFLWASSAFDVPLVDTPRSETLAAHVERAADLPIDRLLVFGDSLSDPGNLKRRLLGVPLREPYWKGRFQEGPNHSDYLARALDVPMDNLAVGGARIRGATGLGRVVPLDTQIDTWLDAHPSVPETTLVVLWIGGNDYFEDRRDPGRNVADIMASLDVLRDAGARRFLLPTMVSLEGLPDPITYADGRVVPDETVRDWIETHNRLLVAQTRRWSVDHGVSAVVSDTYGTYQRVMRDPAESGYTNVTESCFSGGFWTWPLADAEVCPNPDAYLFWDGVHPVTKQHCKYAAAHLSALAAQGDLGLHIDGDVAFLDCNAP